MLRVFILSGDIRGNFGFILVFFVIFKVYIIICIIFVIIFFKFVVIYLVFVFGICISKFLDIIKD